MSRVLLCCGAVLLSSAAAAAVPAHFADHGEALPWRQDTYSPETRRRQLLDELFQQQTKAENESTLPLREQPRQPSRLCGHLHASQTTTTAGAW